jgi:hypothetical protein
VRIYGARPLTRLEAAIYGTIAALLVGLFASRMLEAMELAERTAMQATVARLNAAITARLAYEVMRGEVGNVQAWTRRNPFELARMSPGNFSGTFEAPVSGALERGSWAFDVARAELIYAPRLRTGLQTSDPDGFVRFHGVAAANGMGYALVPAMSYRWE